TGAIDEATSARLAAALRPDTPLIPVGRIADPTQFVVRGRIFRDGRPHPGGLVRAFDRGLRSETLLGESTSDSDGSYEIGYSADRLARSEMGGADLLVRVFDDQDAQLATSRILFNARQLETIDLDVGTDRRVPSE